MTPNLKKWQNRQIVLACSGLTLLALLVGCDWMPGAPKASDKWHPESSLTDFTDLYRENCLACHSDGSTTSASIPMNFPEYLRFIPVAKLHEVIANGVPGTPMPGFADSNGGPLTTEQIKVLVAGIIAWDTGTKVSVDHPPYSAPLGDVAAGGTAYSTHCASCHGPDGHGGTAGSILDPAYLGIVSDQYLRTINVVGRPDLGMPAPQLTPTEVSDVTAWIASHRPPSTEPEGADPMPSNPPMPVPTQTPTAE
ncbi:MAG: c-type cytochrome [Chthoniobacterales bacterium]